MNLEQQLASQLSAYQEQSESAQRRLVELREELEDLYAFRSQHESVYDQATFEITQHRNFFDVLKNDANGLGCVSQIHALLHEQLYGQGAQKVIAEKEQEKQGILQAIKKHEQEIEDTQYLISSLQMKQDECSQQIIRARSENE